MKLNEIMKKLKPSQWYHWVGYGTVGTVIASGIAVGVVFGVKNNDDNNPNPGTINEGGSTTTKKQGAQADLPNVSSKSIDVKGTLIPNLLAKGTLDVPKVVAALKALNIPVDISKGTSYDKRHNHTRKVIGNKHHAIDRFVGAWNKLTTAQKNALNRHSFAYLFGYVPEGNYHIGHQVEYILLDPVNKTSGTTSPTSGTTSTKTTVVADAFVTWIKTLNNASFASLVDNNKLASAITTTDVLNVMKALPTFTALASADQAKLKLSDISIYNIDNIDGLLSIKISNHPSDIKFQRISGFKHATVTQAMVTNTADYKKSLSDIIAAINGFSKGTDTIKYYESTTSWGKKYTLPLIGKDVTTLNAFDTILTKWGFNDKDIFAVTNSDLNNPVDKNKKVKSIFKIGYENNNKFYLSSDHATSYNSAADAIAAYKAANLKSGTFIDFIKTELDSIKKNYALFGTPATTTTADRIINDANNGVADKIIKSLTTTQQTALKQLVDKYIPGGANGTTNSQSQTAVVYSKDAHSKFMNNNIELIHGSGSYHTSAKVGHDYKIIWGLLASSKKEPLKTLLTKFQGFDKSIFPNVSDISIINTGVHDKNSKDVVFMFFKVNSKWIFATDYINNIEGKKVKLTINSSFANIATDTTIINKGFADLVTYTKGSMGS